MFNFSFAWILLLALLIAAFVIWQRSQKNRSAEKSSSASQENPLVAAPKTVPPPEMIETAAQQGSFDPDATQIFRRSNPAPAAVALNRAGATVDTATIVGLSGSQRGRSYQVVEVGLTIGRSPSCDVVLDDHRVSSRHAWVGIVDGKAVLRDLESTNGTFLNTATQTPIRQVELCGGDTIFFGGHQGDQFRFVASGTAKQTQ